MRARSATLFLILLAAIQGTPVPAVAGDLIPVDDGYTISRRYDMYLGNYEGLSWPVSAFQAGQQVLFDRRYKQIGERELHIDLFLPPPETRNGAGILLVHGGGWRSGNKSHFYDLANRLTQRGYAVFLPEYRLSPEAAYPAGLIDVNDAIVWVKGQADAFGIAPDRLAIGGASSGGQMAALLAYTADTDLFKSVPGTDTSVSALIDIDGVLSFTTPLALEYENAAGAKGAAGLWLGGAMQDMPDRWREASATTHIDAASPPTLVISSGIPRFTAGHEIVGPALQSHGIRYSYVTFADAPHDIWLFDPWFSQIIDHIDTFLKDH